MEFSIESGHPQDAWLKAWPPKKKTEVQIETESTLYPRYSQPKGEQLHEELARGPSSL